MNAQRTRWAGMMIGVSLVLGCGSRPSGEPPEPNNGNTTLVVQNRSGSDMDIFMVRMGQSTRLGIASANLTTRFQVSRAQAVGVGTVAFVARPLIAGIARTAASEPTVLRPGDVITLEIPPP